MFPSPPLLLFPQELKRRWPRWPATRWSHSFVFWLKSTTFMLNRRLWSSDLVIFRLPRKSGAQPQRRRRRRRSRKSSHHAMCLLVFFHGLAHQLIAIGARQSNSITDSTISVPRSELLTRSSVRLASLSVPRMVPVYLTLVVSNSVWLVASLTTRQARPRSCVFHSLTLWASLATSPRKLSKLKPHVSNSKFPRSSG